MHPHYDDALGDSRTDFLKTDSPKLLFVADGILAVVYFFVLAFVFPIGNPLLFSLLIAGEIFHVWQVFTYLYTVWETDYEHRRRGGYAPPVDVFITVAGEPIELIEETVAAARVMRYPEYRISILNDGFVAQKDNWREVEALAERMNVNCITRTVPGGAKAGNINNALRFTAHPLIAMFDADHVPHSDFLEKTVPHFGDAKVAFVQTPQYYRNHAENYIATSSWQQQELFFGAICKGKNRLNAVTMCGTNMVVRRAALLEVGGMCTESIAEDFITGLMMHGKGYRSVYVPEVLAEGLATEDLLSYSKQQFRWARGALDVIFRWNPFFMRGFTWAQKFQYVSSASFYLSGLFVFIDALLPLAHFYFGIVPVHISGMLLATVFLPYFLWTLYIIERTSNFTFTFASLGFSMGSFTIHLRALFSAATLRKSAFNITTKYRQNGNFLPLVTWHLAYIGLVAIGIPFAFVREGLSASLLNNAAWAFLNVLVFVPFIRAALPSETRELSRAEVPTRPVAYEPVSRQ